MKVCPDCQSRFTQGETFCPNDGTRLVDARELSPGKLTGLSLDDMVTLEELELSDGLGERYRGKLEEGGTQLRVTAFNQAFVPDVDRAEELESALEAHSAPFPSEILALHSYKLDGDPPFTIEEYPTGPSLRTLLDERKSLDWQTSVRIAANVARAAGYLVDKGIFHSCIHPGSIFISDVEQGRVQLGEWAHGVLSHRSSPLAYADEHPDGFFGYAGYMAPETVRDGDDVDLRSIVYVSGMLLYEMIVGKAPFTSKKSEDTLKRHLHEKPLKLAIAKSGADLPAELDDVLDMMWIKAPERRFQNPTAAIGALASLLDTTANVLAPELSPRDEAVFDGPVPGAVDEQEGEEEEADVDESAAKDEQADASGSAKKTMMGLPSVATSEDDEDEAEEESSDDEEEPDAEEEAAEEEQADDEEQQDEKHEQPPESGPGPSIIIEDPELRSAMDHEDEEDDEADETDSASDDEGEQEDVDTPERQTMLMGGQVSDVEEDEDDEEAKDDEDASSEDEADAEGDDADEPDEEDVDRPNKDTLLMGGDAGWDSLDEEFDSEPSETADDDAESDDEDKSDADDADDTDTEKDQEESEDAKDDADAEEEKDSDADEDQDEDEDEDDTSDKGGNTVGQMAAAGIGSVEVEDDGSGDMSDGWFGKSTEETWETQQVEAVQQQSENVIRYATIGVLAALVLGVVGFFIFVETGDDEPQTSGDAGEATATAEQEAGTADEDTDEVDIDRLKANFDGAISGERILSPRSNSALGYLEQLKRHGADSEQYEDARKTFVEEARSRAEEAQEENIYLARNLAGAAAQFSDDEDVQAFADELDEKWRESQDGDADAGTDTGETAATEEAATTARKPADDKPTSRPTRREPKPQPSKSPPRTFGDTSPQSGNSVSSLLEKADSARSGGNNAEAKRLYRKVLDKSSSNSRALSSLGALYFDDAAYSQAAKYYERAVRSSGGNMGYRLRLGMTYYKLGQFTRARDTWRAVVDRDPGNARAKQYIKLVESKIN